MVRESFRCKHCSAAAKVSDPCLPHLRWNLASIERERHPFCSFCVHRKSHIAGHIVDPHEELTLNKQTYFKSKICLASELFSVFISVSVKSNSAFEIFTVNKTPLIPGDGIMVVRMGLKELGVSEVHHLGPSRTLL